MPMRIADKHRKAAAVLALDGTQQSAADAIGKTSGTIRHWMKRPEFRELVEHYRANPPDAEPHIAEVVHDPEWRASVTTALEAAGLRSVQYLAECVAPGQRPSAVGVNAAKVLMEKASVATLEPEVETGPETPEEQVALMWTFPIEVLAAVFALKTANRWRAPTDDEIRDALNEARVH